MRPLIPARWAAPAATVLGVALYGLETWVTMPGWGRYIVGAVVVLASALGIEAPITAGRAAQSEAETWPK